VKLELVYSTKSELYSLIICHGLWYAVKFFYSNICLWCTDIYSNTNFRICLSCSFVLIFYFVDFQIFYSKRVAKILHSFPVFLFFVMPFMRGRSSSCLATLCDFVKGKSVNGYCFIRCILIGLLVDHLIFFISIISKFKWLYIWRLEQHFEIYWICRISAPCSWDYIGNYCACCVFFAKIAVHFSDNELVT
jgi:hypothetical protein